MPVSKKRKKKGKNRRRSNNSYSGRIQKRTPELGAHEQLMKRAKAHNPNLIVKKNAFKHKVSELLSEFGEDILDPCETKEDYDRCIILLIISWNIGNSEDEKEREEQIQKFLKESKSPELESILRLMINRKLAGYNQYKYVVVDFNVEYLGPGDFYLTVSSMMG